MRLRMQVPTAAAQKGLAKRVRGFSVFKKVGLEKVGWIWKNGEKLEVGLEKTKNPRWIWKNALLKERFFKKSFIFPVGLYFSLQVYDSIANACIKQF
jgi:hypothetical protein